MKRKAIISIIIIIAVIIADQILKIWVKTNLPLGGGIPIIGNRIMIYFTENYGMAFGLSFGGETGKLILSLIRIFAIVALAYVIVKFIRAGEKLFVIVCLSLILAGATGNFIDSAFYGMIFSESSPHNVAEMFPEDGGYGKFLHGKVVDMFYCPVIQTNYPEWSPIKPGERFVFFSPVFNIADSAITVAAFMMLFYFIRDYKKNEKKEKDDKVKNEQ